MDADDIKGCKVQTIIYTPTGSYNGLTEVERIENYNRFISSSLDNEKGFNVGVDSEKLTITHKI